MGSLSDCRLHVAITPFSKNLVPEGIHVAQSESFDSTTLLRCEWPLSKPCFRLPEGGSGGDIVAEQIFVSWCNNKLIYPISVDAKPLAEKITPTQIIYSSSFLAQLDGQVAYVPFTPDPTLTSFAEAVNGNSSSPKDAPSSFLIIIESSIAEFHAIRFLPTQAVIIDPFIKHSMPIPVNGDFKFTVWHRADADPAGVLPIVVNLNKVDRLKQVSSRQIGTETLLQREQPIIQLINENFSQDLKALEEASNDSISPYGQFIQDFSLHTEQITELRWPGADNDDGFAGVLEQDFLVTWRRPLDPLSPPDTLELEFEGLSGSFIGEKGRPGVEYSTELGVYKADLLMARPDGSFYIQPSDHTSVFAMALALPSTENGNPVEESLKVFIFRNGSTVRLEPKIWHSVPVPLACTQTGILFREIISATNANLVINVKAENGHSIQFVHGI